jgi:hypothetical protein
VARYLPSPLVKIYRDDWLQRYRWFAERAGHLDAFERGEAEAAWRAPADRHRYRRWRLSADVLEQVFSWSYVEQQMTRLARQGVAHVVLADVGKNVCAFHRGAEAARLKVLAIADDHLAAADRAYRGIPVVTTEQALRQGADAWVVSNTSYVHAIRRRNELSGRTSKPVYSWFEPPTQTAGAPSPAASATEPPVAAVLPRGSARALQNAAWNASRAGAPCVGSTVRPVGPLTEKRCPVG